MSEYLPETGIISDERRHEAALFIDSQETTGGCLYQISEEFYQRYAYLLQREHGVIAQIAHPLDASDKLAGITETLIFDARGREAGRYMWELTHRRKGARQIWQLDIGPEINLGRLYTTSNQGVQTSREKLAESDVNELTVYVMSLLGSSEIAAQIQERIDRRVLAERELAKFAAESSPPAQAKDRDVRKYESDYERRENLVVAIGFTPLAPYKPTEPILD